MFHLVRTPDSKAIFDLDPHPSIYGEPGSHPLSIPTSPADTVSGLIPDFAFSPVKMASNDMRGCRNDQEMVNLEKQYVSQLLRMAIERRHNDTKSKDEVDGDLAYAQSHPQEPSSPSQLKCHKCPECQKSFKFMSNMIEHRSVHFPGAQLHFTCTICNKQCRLRGNLKKHLRMHFRSIDEINAAWAEMIKSFKRKKNRA